MRVEVSGDYMPSYSSSSDNSSTSGESQDDEDVEEEDEQHRQLEAAVECGHGSLVSREWFEHVLC